MRKPIQAPSPLLMTESDWCTSQLSVARHYGQVQFNGHRYIIVDKHGRDLWECTAAANREGRNMAIEPGEPADLIWYKLQRHYKRLGRDRIIELIQSGKTFAEIASTPSPTIRNAASAAPDEASLFDVDMN